MKIFSQNKSVSLGEWRHNALYSTSLCRLLADVSGDFFYNN